MKNKVNLILVILITIIYVLGIQSLVYADESLKITSTPAATQIKPGETISIDLKSSNIPESGIIGVDFAVEFDKKIVSSSDSYNDVFSFKPDSKWSVEYPVKSDGITGHEGVSLMISNMDAPVKEAGNIGTINIKTLSNVSNGTYKVKILNMKVTPMSGSVISIDDVTYDIKIGTETTPSETGNNNPNNTNTQKGNNIINNAINNTNTNTNKNTANNTSNNTSNKANNVSNTNNTNKNDTSNKVLPKTGDGESTNKFKFVVGALIIGAVVLYFKEKNIDIE